MILPKWKMVLLFWGYPEYPDDSGQMKKVESYFEATRSTWIILTTWKKVVLFWGYLEYPDDYGQIKNGSFILRLPGVPFFLETSSPIPKAFIHHFRSYLIGYLHSTLSYPAMITYPHLVSSKPKDNYSKTWEIRNSHFKKIQSGHPSLLEYQYGYMINRQKVI